MSIRRTIVVLAVGAVFVGLAQPAQAALATRALYNMDRLPMVDSAGGDNNGTTSNITVSGGAYKFNGTSSTAKVADKPNLDPGTAGIRLTARVSVTVVPRVGQSYDILRKGVQTTKGGYYKMEIIRSSTGNAIAACRFMDSAGQDVRILGTAALQNKGFVTITCSKTSTGITIAAGGTSTKTTRNVGSISNAAPLNVGSKGDGTDYFAGLMDLVKIEIG